MSHLTSLVCSLGCIGCLLLEGFAFGPTASAAVPPTALHLRIDALLEKYWSAHKVTPATRCDDAEFLRRISLDLTGVIPTAARARRFLDDTSSDKRRQLIDELLASPDYALHMARVFDVMLTERRIPTITSYDVPQAQWRAYLAESFAENKPWDTLVREVLGSEGVSAKAVGGAKFYLVRDAAPHAVTRDIGRLFLGVDLQCAQCHDDPRFSDYRQADYYGIYAFIQRIKLHPLQPRGATVAETAEGKTSFTSVFTAKKGETNPKLPGGVMLADPEIEKGKEYLVKPGKEPSVPTYSRRMKLSEQLPRHETNGFSRNIANRLWAMFFGRGVVHPLDLHHAENPPSQPALLELLENWIVEHKYDIRGFVRELVLSEAYQRSSALPTGAKEPPVEAFAMSRLRGLTAEQLRWSMLQATGRIEQHDAKLAAATKSSQATKSPVPESRPEPLWKTKQLRYEALERQTVSLMTAFAGLPGQSEAEFQPVVDQALFLRNNTKWIALLQDEPGTLLSRLATLTDSELLAEELYLSVLSRRPHADETNEVQQLMAPLSTPAERRDALQALLWGLLQSAEFRLNH